MELAPAPAEPRGSYMELAPAHLACRVELGIELNRVGSDVPCGSVKSLAFGRFTQLVGVPRARRDRLCRVLSCV